MTDELLAELLAFPQPESDDVVDRVSPALNEGNVRFVPISSAPSVHLRVHSGDDLCIP